MRVLKFRGLEEFCVAMSALQENLQLELEVSFFFSNQASSIIFSMLKKNLSDSSVMPAPQAIFINSTVVVVSWNVSNFHRGGPDIEYEIRIVYQHTENQHIFRVSHPVAQLEINLEKISDEKVL